MEFKVGDKVTVSRMLSSNGYWVGRECTVLAVYWSDYKMTLTLETVEPVRGKSVNAKIRCEQFAENCMAWDEYVNRENGEDAAFDAKLESNRQARLHRTKYKEVGA